MSLKSEEVFWHILHPQKEKVGKVHAEYLRNKVVSEETHLPMRSSRPAELTAGHNSSRGWEWFTSLSLLKKPLAEQSPLFLHKAASSLVACEPHWESFLGGSGESIPTPFANDNLWVSQEPSFFGVPGIKPRPWLKSVSPYPHSCSPIYCLCVWRAHRERSMVMPSEYSLLSLCILSH